MKFRRLFALISILATAAGLCGCTKMIDIKPEQLPEHENAFIAGAALETIITGVTLTSEITVHFDSLGGVYYHGDGAIRGLTWDGIDTAVNLSDIKYIHVASCDTTQCVAYSMDVPSLRAKDRLWQVLEDGGKVPPVELIEFDSAGATYDAAKQSVIARTRRGQDVEFWLSHVRYLRVGGLDYGARTSELRARASLGMSSLTGGDSPIASTENASRPGFSFGLVGRQWFRPGFCLQVEANLSRFSGKRTWIRSDLESTYTVVDKIKFTQFELPALARFRWMQKDSFAAHIYSGGYLAFYLETVTEFDSTRSISTFDYTTFGTVEIANSQTAAFGLILGCDVEYSLMGISSSVDIRYTYSLTPLLSKYGEPYDLEYNYRPLVDESGDPVDLKMSHLSLSVGVRLF